MDEQGSSGVLVMEGGRMKTKAWTVLVATALVLGSMSLAWGDTFVGEVRSDGAAIRAGGSMAHFVVAKLDNGAKLVVVKQLGDWFVVRIPKDVPVYVSTKWVRKEAGDSGVVTGDRVNLRATPDTKYAALGETGRGTVVKILGEAGEWMKIVPPDTAVGWVYKTYLHRVEGASTDEVDKGHYQQVQKDEAAKKGDEAKLAQLGASYQAANDAFLKDELDRAKPLFEQVARDGKGTPVAEKAEAQLELLKGRVAEKQRQVEKAKRMEQAQSELNRKWIEDLMKAYDQAVSEIKPKKPLYAATGSLEGLGLVLLRRGTHKLVDANGFEAYTLRAAPGSGVDLYDTRYFEKKVGVRGKVFEVPGWPTKIVEVEAIDLLE
jgi:uncharacterized protein YgiM (DUF1202 family)